MKKISLTLMAMVFLGGALLLTGCGKKETELANPASVYCQEQGGTLDMRQTEAGEVGFCIFVDNSECEEWTFFRGECAAGQEFRLEKSLAAAMAWLENNSATYKFDGSDLQYLKQNPIKCLFCYQFVFSFNSSATGYGNRAGQNLGQVVTAHEIAITVQKGQVVEATTDNVFDEIKGTLLAGEEMTVNLYFHNTQKDPEMMDCTKLYPVERIVENSQDALKLTLEELIKGPSEAEKEQGYLTTINAQTKVNKIEVEQAVAKVDFSAELDPGGGSCAVTSVRAQVEQTLKPFVGVEAVEISINGQSEDILQP